MITKPALRKKPRIEVHTANLLGALAVACGDIQREVLDAHGLDPGTAAVLFGIHTRAGSNVGELAQAADLTHSGAVRAVNRLESLRLVRRGHGKDRRVVELSCTVAGNALAKKLLRARRSAHESILERLTKSEIREFHAIASKLLGGFPSNRTEAWRVCRFCEHAVCSGKDCPVGSAVP